MYELDHARVPGHDVVEAGTGEPGNVGEGSVFWRELPALWVATGVALFQAGRVGDNDDK